MVNIKKLKEQRVKHIEDARAISEAGGENLSSDDQVKFDEHMKRASDIQDRIEREEKLLAAEKDLGTVPEEERAVEHAQGKVADSSISQEEKKEQLFRSWIADGVDGLQRHEYRDLAANVMTAGGSFIPPVKWINKLIQAVDNKVFLRQLGTTFQLNGAHSMGVPTLETDPSAASWTSEVPSAPTADSTMATGGREMKPSPLIKLLKASKFLLRHSVISVDTLILDRLAYLFSIAEEAGYFTGTGASQPLGMYTASDYGISTGRDVSTGNTTTAMTFDGLIEAKYTLNDQYINNSSWIFHSDGMKQLVKIKDGDGNYIWRESVSAGEPDKLLGRPVRTSAYNPNTFTTGLYVGIIGDLSYYWICDSLQLELQRLVEKYALTRQVGFLMDKETDGMPVLEEAFVRVKLA